MTRSPRYIVLLGLTLIAAWLRFSAIGFGLPDQYRPDEEMTVPPALGFEHDFNPHLAIYPAAQTYLIHGVLRSWAALSGAGTNWRRMYSAQGDERAFRIARQITAAMATATVPAIYFAAAPIFGPEAALASGAILAVTFLHVRESKSAKVEVPAAFWLALSIAMILRIATRGRRADYALAGLFCGLAAATHYTAGTIAVGIVAAHLEARKREGRPLIESLLDVRIYLAGELALLGFLCADPYFVIDSTQTANDLAFLHHVYSDWNGGHSVAGYGSSWLFLRAMPASFGVALEIFLLVALVWVAFRPKPGTYALLAFVIACFISLMGGRPQLEFRYLVNPLTAIVILGGVMASDLMMMGRCRMGAAGAIVMATAGALLLAPSVVRDLQLNHLLQKTDTRTIAKLWILDRIPEGAKVTLIGGYSYAKPKIAANYNLSQVDNKSVTSLRDAIKTTNWVIADSFPPLIEWSSAPNEDQLEELAAKGELELDLPSIRTGAAQPVCDPNDAFYVPFTHITSMIRPGPRIRVWRIRPSEKSPAGVDAGKQARERQN